MSGTLNQMKLIAAVICLAGGGFAASLRHQAIELPSQKVQADMEKFIGCALIGSYGSASTKPSGKREIYEALNIKKNRFSFPRSFNQKITLAKMAAPGDDTNRWDQNAEIPVRVTGYVAFLIQNFEGESCNCFKHDDAHSDTHIDLVMDPDETADFTKHVVVEITPRMKYLAKTRGLNWSSNSLSKQFLGKRVTVEGWLMWDGEHGKQAQNTHPHDPSHLNWRATCWEVHPVTNIYLAGKG
jgi:hypothetical protein